MHEQLGGEPHSQSQLNSLTLRVEGRQVVNGFKGGPSESVVDSRGDPQSLKQTLRRGGKSMEAYKGGSIKHVIRR